MLLHPWHVACFTGKGIIFKKVHSCLHNDNIILNKYAFYSDL